MPRPPLSTVLPPLICGTGTFNFQFADDPFQVPAEDIVYKALSEGVRAFDCSPYYGPAESILGRALDSDNVKQHFQRQDYFLLTKCGRIASDHFDYSPAWVRTSVHRSLDRFHTTYLDVVYCHDVEFVTPADVLGAVAELRRLRDEGLVNYVGISGYPVEVLANLAELILKETGEPIDAVMSYCHLNIQNSRLLHVVPRFVSAGVNVVPNASLLSMGLLRTVGVPITTAGDWHPAPPGLRRACQRASDYCQSQGRALEDVAFQYALKQWLLSGQPVGAAGHPNPPAGTDVRISRLGASVVGISSVQEVDEMMKLWRSAMANVEVFIARGSSSEALEEAELVGEVWKILGEWKDWSWDSPPSK